jgi:hypothetical protein
MRWQWLAWRALAFEWRDTCLCCCQHSQRFILAGRGFILLEGQLHLVEQMPAAPGTLAVKRPPHLLVLQLEKGVAGFQIGIDGLYPGGLGGDQIDA